MNTAVQNNEFVSVDGVGVETRILLKGDWVIENAQDIDLTMRALFSPDSPQSNALSSSTLDCGGLKTLDTTGAVLVRRFAGRVGEHCEATLTGVPDAHKQLLDVITCCPPPARMEPERLPWYVSLLSGTGEAVWMALRSLARLLSFLGLVLVRLIGSISDPRRVRIVPIIHQMDVTGMRAMGIDFFFDRRGYGQSGGDSASQIWCRYFCYRHDGHFALARAGHFAHGYHYCWPFGQRFYCPNWFYGAQ